MQGSLLGTPAYMSPEQARGALDEIDERTDVWALGAVLYEMLTGRRPFVGATPVEVLRKVLSEPIVAPRQIEPAAPSELESICLKALARDKEQRYATASELAREVESWQNGENVFAHDYSAWEHLRRFAAKKRPAIVAAAVVALVVVGALIGVTGALGRERLARQAEARQRLLADYHLAEALQEKAARLGRGGAFLSAAVYAAASLENNPGAPGRSPEFLAERPDSGRLATEATSWLAQAQVRSAVVHRRTLDVGKPVCSVAMSGDGSLVVAATCDAGVALFDAATGARIRTVDGGPGDNSAVDVTPDGQTAGAGHRQRCGAPGLGGRRPRRFAASPGTRARSRTWRSRPTGETLATAGRGPHGAPVGRGLRAGCADLQGTHGSGPRAWRSRGPAGCSPRAGATPRSGCGTRGPVARSGRWPATPAWCVAWRCRPTARGSRPPPTTRPRGRGRPRTGRRASSPSASRTSCWRPRFPPTGAPWR